MAPDRTVVPAAPDLDGTLTNYKSTVTVVRGETFDPTHRQHRQPRRALEAAERHAGRGAVEEDRQQHGHRHDRAAVRRSRRSLANQREAAVVRRQPADGRHEDPHAPAAAGRIPEAECAGQRVRRRGRRRRRTWRRRRRRRRRVSSATATITAPAENFVAAMRLAVEILKEPAYPQDEFDRVKTQRLRALEAARRPSRPSWRPRRLNRHLSPLTRRPTRSTRRRARSSCRRCRRRRSTTRRSSTISSTAPTTASSRWSGRSTPADMQKAAAELLGDWNTPKAVQAARHAVQEGGADQREDRDAGQGECAVPGRRAVPAVAERSRLSGDGAGQLHVRRADHLAHFRSHPQSRRPELRRERAHHGSRGRRCRDAVRHREPESRVRAEGGIQLHGRAEEGVPGRVHRRRSGRSEEGVPGLADGRPIDRRRAAQPDRLARATGSAVHLGCGPGAKDPRRSRPIRSTPRSGSTSIRTACRS